MYHRVISFALSRQPGLESDSCRRKSCDDDGAYFDERPLRFDYHSIKTLIL